MRPRINTTEPSLTKCTPLSTNRNRKRQEAERKHDQGNDADDDAHCAEWFHLFRLRMTDAQHYGEQNHIHETARAAVPEPTEHRNDRHGYKRNPPNPVMRSLAEGCECSMPAVELAHRH